MDEQTPERLKALWKSGRDKYRSFFTVLNEVRREIGDAALADWCRKELQIGMSIIVSTTDVLNKADAAMTRKEFTAAAKAERDKAKHEREIENNRRKLASIVATVKRLKDTSRKSTDKMDRARAIVRPLIEQGLPVKAREKGDSGKYGISHATFEAAAAIEKVMLELSNILADKELHILNHPQEKMNGQDNTSST